ncbi:MAG: inositol monophosphatase family protein [Actinomycetales bacterium]
MTLEAELLRIAVEIANSAGNLLLQRPSNFQLQEKSGALDFATQRDHESEELIVRSIKEIRPGDGIIGEEGTNQVSTTGFTWIIDPIDGTVNYLYGLPGWCISIAIQDENETVVGVVHAPSLNLTWTAIRGQGAFCNGERIGCNESVPLDRALIGTGFAYDISARTKQGEFLKYLIPKVRDLRRLGACAADICQVASGALDAHFEAGVNLWDFAAASLIAREAGAKFLAVAGVPEGEKHFVLVAGPDLYRELGAEIIAQGGWISAI